MKNKYFLICLLSSVIVLGRFGEPSVLDLPAIFDEHSGCFNAFYSTPSSAVNFAATVPLVRFNTRFNGSLDLNLKRSVSLCSCSIFLLPEYFPDEYIKRTFNFLSTIAAGSFHFISTTSTTILKLRKVIPGWCEANVYMHLFDAPYDLDKPVMKVDTTFVWLRNFFFRNRSDEFRYLKQVQYEELPTINGKLTGKTLKRLTTNILGNPKYFRVRNCNRTAPRCMSLRETMLERLGTPFQLISEPDNSSNLFRHDFDTAKFFVIIRYLVYATVDVWIPDNQIYLNPRNDLISDYPDFRPFSDPLPLHGMGANLVAYEDMSPVVPTGEVFYNFVTCDGVKSSMMFYLDPYEPIVWFLVCTTTLMILPTILVFIENFKVKGQDQKKVPVANWREGVAFTLSIGVSVSLEVSPYTDSAFMKRASWKTKLVLITWFYMLGVLVNGYKGIVVSDLTTIPEKVGQYTNISQLNGWLLIVPESYTEHVMNHVRHLNSRPGASIRDTMAERFFKIEGIQACLCYPNDYLVIDIFCENSTLAGSEAFGGYGEEVKGCSAKMKILADRNINGVYKLPLACHRHTLSALLRNISRDNQNFTSQKDFKEQYNSAYVDLCRDLIQVPKEAAVMPDNIKNVPPLAHNLNTAIMTSVGLPYSKLTAGLKNYLKNVTDLTGGCKSVAYIDAEETLKSLVSWSETQPGPKYRMGRNKILPSWAGYYFRSRAVATRHFHIGLQRVIETGLYEIWKKYFTERALSENVQIAIEYKKKFENEGPSPLGLGSNIQSMFKVLPMLLLLGTVVFLLELSWHKRPKKTRINMKTYRKPSKVYKVPQ